MAMTDEVTLLSRKAYFQIIARRIEMAEALVAIVKDAHKTPCAENCIRCWRVARWREARALHEMTEVPKLFAREKKRHEYAAAVAMRMEAAEATVEDVAMEHWGRCPEDCRTCAMLEEWRDAKVVHEAVMAHGERVAGREP